MDIVHHAVIGLIGLNAAENVDRITEGAFFLFGSILPDLDVFLMIFGKRFYLKNHQGFSHSLLLIPLFSIIITALLIPYIDFSWTNLLALALGMFVHIFLDYTNTYGITMFYPYNQKRFSLDSVFFIDTFLLLLSTTIFIFNISFFLYVFLFCFYITFKTYLHRYIHKKLKADFTIPSAFNPFSFYIYKNYDSQIVTYEYNFLTNKINKLTRQKNIDDEFDHLTKQSAIFQDVKQITKALHVIEVQNTSKKTILIAKDLALRNFGGKFATTTLTFDNKEELTNEVSNI